MSKKSFAAPFLLWIICGTVIPLAVVAYYGFTDRSGTFTFANLIAERRACAGAFTVSFAVINQYCDLLCDRFSAGADFKREQAWTAGLYGVHFYLADVDELFTTNDGVAGNSGKGRIDQRSAGTFTSAASCADQYTGSNCTGNGL